MWSPYPSCCLMNSCFVGWKIVITLWLWLVGHCKWQRRWISWFHLELCITTQAVMRKPCRCTERPPACNQTTQKYGWLLWACAHQHKTFTSLKLQTLCLPKCLFKHLRKVTIQNRTYLIYNLALNSSQQWIWFQCVIEVQIHLHLYLHLIALNNCRQLN